MTDHPRLLTPGHHTPGRTRLLAVVALAACLACAGAPRRLPPSALPPVEPVAGLRVRLAFGPEADLDLHVTDPLQETVYFANTPTASGGTLESDVRCDGEGPRVEVVRFETPPPGRYRIGVDFPIRCRRVGGPVPFVLEVLADGIRHERRGAISFGRFEPIVYEVDVAGHPTP